MPIAKLQLVTPGAALIFYVLGAGHAIHDVKGRQSLQSLFH
jgi:hypothetical protein